MAECLSNQARQGLEERLLRFQANKDRLFAGSPFNVSAETAQLPDLHTDAVNTARAHVHGRGMCRALSALVEQDQPDRSSGAWLLKARHKLIGSWRGSRESGRLSRRSFYLSHHGIDCGSDGTHRDFVGGPGVMPAPGVYGDAMIE